jgi:hypothetical protein
VWHAFCALFDCPCCDSFFISYPADEARPQKASPASSKTSKGFVESANFAIIRLLLDAFLLLCVATMIECCLWFEEVTATFPCVWGVLAFALSCIHHDRIDNLIPIGTISGTDKAVRQVNIFVFGPWCEFTRKTLILTTANAFYFSGFPFGFGRLSTWDFVMIGGGQLQAIRLPTSGWYIPQRKHHPSKPAHKRLVHWCPKAEETQLSRAISWCLPDLGEFSGFLVFIIKDINHEYVYCLLRQQVENWKSFLIL